MVVEAVPSVRGEASVVVTKRAMRSERVWSRIFQRQREGRKGRKREGRGEGKKEGRAGDRAFIVKLPARRLERSAKCGWPGWIASHSSTAFYYEVTRQTKKGHNEGAAQRTADGRQESEMTMSRIDDPCGENIKTT